MSNPISVQVEIESGEPSHIAGRNGTFNPMAVEIWEGHDVAYIDGIGRRGKINGGLSLPAKKMDMLAMRWLQARGIVMPATDLKDSKKKDSKAGKKDSKKDRKEPAKKVSVLDKIKKFFAM